jgi:ribonucleoside-diphosphate reductase alpha chain
VELSDNAIKILKARYLLKDRDGNIDETPKEMCRRIAGKIASAEKSYDEDVSLVEEEFYRLLSSLKFLPNSPAIMNAGKEAGQLAACFVLPVEDSMRSIFDTLKNAALILQSGGGTGFSFSKLRPKADGCHKAGRRSKGRKHGHLACGPPRYLGVYQAQEKERRID